MPIRNSDATWEGGLKGGKGRVKLGSGAYEGNYSFISRFEQGPGTNPEELIAAGHAGCYSMALSAMLEKGGHPATRVHTTAKVHIEKVGEGFKITKIQLQTDGTVPGIDEKTFRETAEKAKTGCPVSQALSAVPIELDAKFVK